MIGTYEDFDARYQPIDDGQGTIMRDWRDIPSDTPVEFVWTVVECDGEMFLAPGYHKVNYMGRVMCRNPWEDDAHDYEY